MRRLFAELICVPLNAGATVMRNLQNQKIMVIRWLFLLFVCLSILGLGLVVEHELIGGGRVICPQGWWRESPGLCAFPFVSILTLSFAYGVKSMLLLIATATLAPAKKFTSCVLILTGLALWPAQALALEENSWVALVSLSGVIAMAACFVLGAYVMHSLQTRRAKVRSSTLR